MYLMPYKDTRGIVYGYGEFFPAEISMHPYNQTLAQNFFPLTKEQILSSGFYYREEQKSEFAITLSSSQIPDHIKDASDSILQDVIECISCARGFRMIRNEFAFLREMNLLLPRECPQCRIRKKFAKWIKHMEVYNRSCSRCGATFQSEYSEDAVSNILCLDCHRQKAC